MAYGTPPRCAVPDVPERHGSPWSRRCGVVMDRPAVSPLLRIGQVVGVGLLVAVVAGGLPIPKSLTHDLPQQTRWLAALVGLSIGAGFLWLDHRLDVSGAWARLPPWGRLVALLVGCGALFLIRPRLHWGDSAALISALDAGVHRWNPRWLTSMIVLAYAFDPLRSMMSGTLFLTLAYIGLGCLDVALLTATLRIVGEGRKVPSAAVLLVMASPATLFLMSGYLEIYAVTQFGIAVFLWAAAAFSFRRRWMGFPLFGLVCGLAGLLYIGNLILLPLGTVLMGTRLMAEPVRSWKSQLRRGLGFAAGALLGVHASLCLVIGEFWPGLSRMLAAATSILGETAVVLRHEATGTAWYAPFLDVLSVVRLRQYCETWSLYGVFGLFLIVLLASSQLFDKASRRASKSTSDCFVLVLAGLVGALLIASFIKTQPMRWQDWDVFAYVAYPVNLLAACLLLRLQHVPSVSALGRTFSICACVWCVMVYAYLNPLRPEWSKLPPRRRVLAFESYHPLSRISASEAEARGIREVRPFP